MMARSRRTTTVDTSMPVSRAVASSEDSTGVTPFVTEWRGPRRECAGFVGITCPDHEPVKQSNNNPDTGQMLLYSGSRPLAPQKFDIRGHVHRLNAPERLNPCPHQLRKAVAARAYAARVFRLRMLTRKNSRKRNAV
jgi:hypothetical protein